MKLSILFYSGKPLIKGYLTVAEWEAFGKPFAVVPYGTLRKGLGLTFVSSPREGARKISDQNGGKTKQFSLGQTSSILGLRPARLRVAPIEPRLRSRR